MANKRKKFDSCIMILLLVSSASLPHKVFAQENNIPLRGPIDAAGTSKSKPADTTAGSNKTDADRRDTSRNSSSDSDNSTDPSISNDPANEPAQIAGDTDTFNPKQIKLSRPELSGLITITTKLDPFNLDAERKTKVNLKDVLNICLERNLDIGIAKAQRSNQGWKYTSSATNFLPDIKMSYSYNGLKGALNLPIGQNPDPLKFNNPFIIANAGFTYYLYRGGSTLFGTLEERNKYRASQQAEKQTIDNALNQTFELYYKLLLEESVLRIRIKAVEVSQEQVRLNRQLFDAGSATQLDVMQAETQLSEDRQKLIEQQIRRRQVAIDLSDFLNIPQEQDLLPMDLYLEKRTIIGDESKVGLLLGKALSSRPVLKQRDEEYRAAKKQIIVAQAPLHPQVKLDGNVFGIGETLSSKHKTIIASTPVATPGGGITTVLSPRTVNRQISALYQLGLSVNWKFGSLGTRDLANTQAARMKAREAMLIQKREVNKVINQVRRSFLNVLRTDKQIEEALAQLRAAKEEIKLARLRYENGLGKNIDILRAQRDYTNALIRKATAIVDYNIAQSNLLRDMGTISVSTLTTRGPLNLN